MGNIELDEKALLPCPFCGEEAFIYYSTANEKFVKVSCKKDCVTMPPRFDNWFTSEEEAVQHWNRRISIVQEKTDKV